MKRHAVCLMLLGVWGGCADRGLPERAQVTGTVTFRGRPLANAHVSFQPNSGGLPASGLTDAEGHFQLGTYAADDGALLGSHRIGVIARGPDRRPNPGEIGSGMPGELLPGPPVIPEKYFAADTSGLSFEVQRGVKNHCELSLTE